MRDILKHRMATGKVLFQEKLILKLIIITSLFLVPGCTKVTYVRAQPDISVSRTKINAPLVIILDKHIKDQFVVRGSVKDIRISDYRKSVKDAIEKTFKNNFTSLEFSDDYPEKGIYLHIKDAKPIQVQETYSINLDIQWRMTIGSDGEERQKIEMISRGKFKATMVNQFYQLLRESIEVMCEDMYDNIFSKKENLAVFALKGRQYEMAIVKGKQRVAVMDFKRNAGITAVEAKYLTDKVRNGLIKTGLFDVVTNDQIATMLKMEEMRQAFGTECESKNCQINLGRALECRYVVVGDIQHAFKEYSVAVKILSVTDQKYIHAEEITVADKNRLPEASQKIVELITGKRD